MARRVVIALVVLGLAALAAAPLEARTGASHEGKRSARSIRAVTRISLGKAVCVRHRRCRRFGEPQALGGRSAAAVSPGPTPTPARPIPGDTTPPRFGGLQSAFACTPGPQRPGQTTPFNLSWEAASDDVTPTKSIVYDVYLATSPGGEDFSKPTWTTEPGVTSFRTPGLPSHGTFYFVVRARDRAGNEDANLVELLGSDPCL
jgi:hypothetical protein